jgi:hypothetical protein
LTIVRSFWPNRLEQNIDSTPVRDLNGDHPRKKNKSNWNWGFAYATSMTSWIACKILCWIDSRCQFHIHFMCNFSARRSQKHKKTDKLTVFFVLLESAWVKGGHKMLEKFTQGFQTVPCWSKDPSIQIISNTFLVYFRLPSPMCHLEPLFQITSFFLGKKQLKTGLPF